MTMTKSRRCFATVSGVLAAALGGLVAMSPAQASALECSDLPSGLRAAPLSSESLEVVDTQKLFRVQQRPWVRVPTGARLTVRAPAGVTAADIHRAMRCSPEQHSPLTVEGAKLIVKRVGDLYQLHVTADSRGAAREIQQRAAAL